MLRALLFITSLVFAGAATAQYKWVDQNGRVQYGDTPPPGVQAAPLRPSPAPIRQPEAKKDDAKKTPQTLAEKEADFRRRQQQAEKEREKHAQAELEAQGKRENCARSQESLRTLQTGRVARIDAKGERYYLDDQQIAQETVKARQLVQQWCH